MHRRASRQSGEVDTGRRTDLVGTLIPPCMTITRSQHLIPCTMVVVYYSSELYSLFQRVDGTLVETPVELVARVVDCVRVSVQLLLTGYS